MVRVLGSQVGCCWAGAESLEDLKKSKRPIFYRYMVCKRESRWNKGDSKDEDEMRRDRRELNGKEDRQVREKVGSGLMYLRTLPLVETPGER
jgi:hypothetical protein